MSKLAGLKKVLLGSVCGAGLVLATQVHAQVATYYDNNVIVDLSVIDDNGLGNKKPSVSSPLSSAKLPPVSLPKSTFHGLPQDVQPANTTSSVQKLRLPESKPTSRIVLKKPPAQPSLPAKRLASTPKIQLKKPVIATAPKPMAKKVEIAKPVEPKPVVVAKPKPTPVVEAKKAEPPKPMPVPSKPVEVVKADPLPTPAAPKVMPKKETPPPAPTPAPAPKEVMAEAPPPPPPSAVEPKQVEVAMKKEEAKKPVTTTAAIPPSSSAAVRVAFDEGQSKLPGSVKGDLDKLAETLRKQADDRIQLLAYAGGDNLSASKARRLSLSRALAVRSYLIGQGIRSTRIDVRALGNKTTQDPVDRVDVQIAPR